MKPKRKRLRKKPVNLDTFEHSVAVLEKSFEALVRALKPYEPSAEIQAKLQEHADALSVFTQTLELHPEPAPPPVVAKNEAAGFGAIRKQFGRHDLSQVPAGYVFGVVDETKAVALFKKEPIKRAILGSDMRTMAVELLLTIAELISQDLAFQVVELALRSPAQPSLVRDPQQIAKWLTTTYRSHQVIKGEATKEDRRLQVLPKLQRALTVQLHGLAELREERRLADWAGAPNWVRPPSTVPESPHLQQPTAYEVHRHLAKYFELPPELDAAAIESMLKRVSLNPGAKGKATADKVVRDFFLNLDKSSI